MNSLSLVLFDELFTALWQGTLLFLIVWTLCKVFPRVSPKVRYWLWWLAAVKLLIPFVPTSGANLPVHGPVVIPHSFSAALVTASASSGAMNSPASTSSPVQWLT